MRKKIDKKMWEKGEKARNKRGIGWKLTKKEKKIDEGITKENKRRLKNRKKKENGRKKMEEMGKKMEKGVCMKEKELFETKKDRRKDKERGKWLYMDLSWLFWGGSEGGSYKKKGGGITTGIYTEKPR